MLVKLVLVAVLLVIIGLIALRFARSNSIERSISWHRRRLGSIQGIVERSAERNSREPHDEEEVAAPEPPSAPLSTGLVREKQSRAEIEIGKDTPVSEEGRLVFGDLSITPVKPPVPPIYERRPRRSSRSSSNGTHFRSRDPRSSKTIVIASVLAALILVGAGATYLALHHGHSLGPGTSTTTTAVNSVTTKTTVPASRSHPRSNGVQLVSSTKTSATFRAPSGSYSIKVDVSGPCWLGFEHQRTGGNWLATPTVGEKNVFTYSLTSSGQVVIVIGNPPNLKTISVNGSAVVLPKLPPYGYQVIFN